MSDMPDQKPKPLMTFVFDEVTVFTLKAEANPQAEIKPPSKNAPILTVEADEMTEFIVRAIPASDLAAQTGQT
jgi:hypothetical protein